MHRIRQQLERDIEARVCEYARRFGVRVYKFTSPAQRSVPDRLMMYRGRVWFIEFKRPGKTLTPKQAAEAEKIEQHGIRVYVIDNVATGKELIDELVKNARGFI